MISCPGSVGGVASGDRATAIKISRLQLDLAHKRLDEAVFAAYGWDAGISDEDLLAKLLALNLERSS